MVSVASTSRYITTASHYHPRYQSRSSMYIRGLIPWNFAEWAEAVPIAEALVHYDQSSLYAFESWSPYLHTGLIEKPLNKLGGYTG